jgi:hypothetical protein
MHRGTKRLVLAIVVLVAAGGSFAALGGMKWLDGWGFRGDEAHLRSRLVGYWEARVDDDLQALAEYAHPSETELMQSGLLATEAYELQGVTIDGDTAVAAVKITSRLRQAGFSARARERVIQQGWVRVDGEWYQEPSPMTLKQAIEHYRARRSSPSGAPPTGAQDRER